MKITKDTIKSLTSKTITKVNYDKAMEAIGEKVNEIWRYICKESGRKLNWWAFQNDVELGNGNGSTGGEFDPEEDAEFISIIGEFSYSKLPDYEYDDGFPTEFLWTDYKTAVQNHLKECKQKKLEQDSDVKGKEKALKENKARIIASIKRKLTQEELKQITFK